jgi:hypothetical protein
MDYINLFSSLHLGLEFLIIAKSYIIVDIGNYLNKLLYYSKLEIIMLFYEVIPFPQNK